MLLYLVWFITSTFFFPIFKFNNTVTFFLLLLLCAVCGILVHWPRMETVPPVVESWCPNQRTTGNSQYFYLYDILPFYIFTYFFSNILNRKLSLLDFTILNFKNIFHSHIWYNRQFCIDGIMSHGHLLCSPQLHHAFASAWIPLPSSYRASEARSLSL